MSERWVITPADGRPLVLPLAQDGGTQVVAIQTPSPARRVVYASRPEGATPTSREWENREITLQVALVPPRDQWASSTHDFGAPAPQAEGNGDLPGWTGNVRRVGPDGNATSPMLSDLTATVAALAAAGGVVRRVLDDGTWLDFDVLDGEVADGPTWDVTYYAAGAMTLTVKLTCAPFGRGRERLIGEGTLPPGRRLLEVGGLAIPGDVPALARLEFSSTASPQRSLLYAIDQPASAAAPDVQIACRDLVAPEGITAGSGGIYPTQARIDNASSPTWRTLVMLRNATSGNPIPASGTFRVFARLRSTGSAATPGTTNTSFRARLRWAAGAREGGLSENAPVAVAAGSWALADLGQVRIPPEVGALDGTIEIAGPVAGAIWGDALLFVPTNRSATASASFAPAVAGVPSVVDPMTGTGPLGGSTAPIGGQWKTFGGGPPWNRSAGGATKTAGAALDASSIVAAASAVGVPITSTQATVSSRAPQTSADAWFPFGLVIGDAAGIASILKYTIDNVSGWAIALTTLRYTGVDLPYLFVVSGGKLTTMGLSGSEPVNPVARPYLAIRADGSVVGSVGGTPVTTTAPANPPSTGVYAGIFSMPVSSGSTMTTVLSDFTVEAPVPPDAVLYPGKIATIASTRATRVTDSGLTGAVSSYYGDRPLLPPSGREGVRARVVMGASRDDLRTGIDSTTGDPFTGRVFATPRYLQIPDQNA